MKANHDPLTQEELDNLYKSSEWRITEMPFDVLSAIRRIVRPKNLLGAFISGSLDQPKFLNGHNSIAGFDVLVHEINPKPEWNEGEINAYHYVIRKSGNKTHPYILSGPYRNGTIIGHHPVGFNLDIY